MIGMVKIAITMIRGINKKILNLSFMLFYVVQGYPDGRVRGKIWDQLPSFCRCLFLLSYNLHVQCKHLNSGGGGLWCCRGCDCQIPAAKD